MTSNQIRQSFLDYFRQRRHTIVPSAPVIPYDDPTLLFTNAGMNQFKDVFLGTDKRDYVRAADTQKCIRVSGKHNDLEEVGRDTYHHTFFEMLGNWSFGDYYKKEAIEWAWDLLTTVWGLEKRRLYATVFETDQEAERLWNSVTDIDPAHVLRFGKKDNFWEMGETGPCGPCSEIHIDLTDDYSGRRLVNAGDPRVMEIWNLVFIQYDRDENGTLTTLPAKHVDTGMGFERICAVLQGKKSNYDTDVFSPIIAHIANVVGKEYRGTIDGSSDIAMRVVADHVRMLTFAIADGGIPSNEGRGYVMRRILRRAARFGRNLGMREPFIYKVVEAVGHSMGDQFPEIREKHSHIERVIRGEEESFNTTLDRGLEIFDSVVTRMGPSATFPGEDAFKLYDTYGFPLDMTEMMARERGLTVDTGRFTELMEEQRERSRGAELSMTPESDTPEAFGYSRQNAKRVDTSEVQNTFRFLGYESVRAEATVVKTESNLIILDQTPFYGEAGGQVGDEGFLVVDSEKFRVVDTQKSGRVNVHILEHPSKLAAHARVVAHVDERRRSSIERNHTATHLVHEAIRRILGTHAHQQGSLVAPDHLRFDFNHFEKVTPDQIRAMEEIVNEKIAESISVHALNDPKDWLTIDEAKRRYPNIKMFFGDKYGDRVRVVEIDPKFSVELCGGTHVKNTGDIGLFKIVSEAGIASGIRRIEAVTGEGLNQYIQKRVEKIGELDEQLTKLLDEKASLERQVGMFTKVDVVPTRPSLGSITLTTGAANVSDVDSVEMALREREQIVDQVTKATFDLKKILSEYRVQEASSSIESIVSAGVSLNGFKVVSAKIEATDVEELKQLGDTLRSRLASGVGVLGAVVNEKVAFVCVVTDDLIKEKKLQAGKIVGELAKRVGGGGGGRPHLATAGGKDVAKLDAALSETMEIVKAMMAKV
jgi:alanyl-tRNA synthetase